MQVGLSVHIPEKPTVPLASTSTLTSETTRDDKVSILLIPQIHVTRQHHKPVNSKVPKARMKSWIGKGKVCIRTVAHAVRAHPTFCSMKRLGVHVFLLPLRPDGMLQCSLSKDYPLKFLHLIAERHCES